MTPQDRIAAADPLAFIEELLHDDLSIDFREFLEDTQQDLQEYLTGIKAFS